MFQVKGDADTLSFLREEIKTERDQEPMRGRNTAPEIEKGEKQGFSLKHHVHQGGRRTTIQAPFGSVRVIPGFGTPERHMKIQLWFLRPQVIATTGNNAYDQFWENGNSALISVKLHFTNQASNRNLYPFPAYKEKSRPRPGPACKDEHKEDEWQSLAGTCILDLPEDGSTSPPHKGSDC